jgi:hypothetical protein
MIRDEKTPSWMDTHVDRMISDKASVSMTQSSRFNDEPRSGQAIRFRLGDVYAPNLADLYRQMTPGLELEGQIILLSDGGDNQAAFALVEVPGVMLPLIVPASCLEAISEATPAETLE